MGGVLMKMHLKKSRKKIVGSLLTIAIISTVIFVANKCYENYLLSQKKLDVTHISDVYEIIISYYGFGGVGGGILTDKTSIEEIMNFLPNVKATNEYINMHQISVAEYQVVIKYYDNDGEEEGYSFSVIERNGKHYLVPFLENELWQMDDEFYNYLNETVVKVVSGELE